MRLKSVWFPIPKLPRKAYQLTHQDGSKKHIDRLERDDLLLSGLIKPSEEDSNSYLYLAAPKTYHSFVDWGKVACVEPVAQQRRFLPGSFIFEHEGKRKREMLETAGALAVRLNLYEQPAQQ